MKTRLTSLLVLCVLAIPVAETAESRDSNANHRASIGGSPVGKVLRLLDELSSKIIKEGEDARAVYMEFNDWCEDRSKNLGFDIKTSKAEIEDLKATIGEETALASSLTSKIEELAGSVAADEADLKAATQIRTQEATDFAVEEKELTEVISMLERAVVILERELQKSSDAAAMLQTTKVKNIAQALAALVQASVFSSADSTRLAGLLQSTSDDGDGDGELGAPEAQPYASQSGDIIATLQNLLTKAEAQLNEARNKETADLHNFEMLKQSLEGEIKFTNEDLSKAKRDIAQSSEKRAVAEGDLAVTTKDLNADIKTKSTLHQTCFDGARDFESEIKHRDEELKALAAAKKALKDMTAGAEAVAYGFGQRSFLQLIGARGNSISNSVTGGATSDRSAALVKLAGFEVVHLLRDLGRKEQAPALSLLASRISSIMQSTDGARDGDDPFGKVKTLISDMLVKLEREAAADATKKAYCDKEMSEATTKQKDKSVLIEQLSTKIDQMAARSAQLKNEIAEIQKALAELASSKSEMDKLRREEKALYTKQKADLEQGLEGVKMALKVLREYYAQSDGNASGGAGASIVSLIEVVESDFTKEMAESTAEENAAKAAYEEESNANEVEKAMKDQDVKYKSKEAVELDKSVTEFRSDRDSVQSELDAVLQYLKSLEAQCIAKAESYSEQKERRQAEIDGLKEALRILDGETMLIQQKTKGKWGAKRSPSLRHVSHF